jgi:putative peptidoglycan lipid II flippase
MLWMCCLLVAVSLAMAAAAHGLFPVIASNFAPAKRALAEELFYALLPMVLLSGIATNCTAVLNSLDRFAWPALAPVLVPVAVVVAVITTSARYGIWSMVTATVIGTFFQMAIVVSLMQRYGYRFNLRWYGMNEAVREVGHQYGPVLLSGVVSSSGLLVDQSMAAWLPAGSVSTLAYASRFVGVVMALVAGAIATAVVPSLARMVAYRNWAGCRLTVRHWTRLTFLVSAPMALVLIVGARPLIRFALEHGHFGAADTAAVAGVLAMYALQIPFFASSRVYYRLIVAARRTDLILYCGIVNFFLDVVLNLVLMRSMGVAGIALATSLWSVSTFFFLRYWARRLIREGEARVEAA